MKDERPWPRGPGLLGSSRVDGGRDGQVSTSATCAPRHPTQRSSRSRSAPPEASKPQLEALARLGTSEARSTGGAIVEYFLVLSITGVKREDHLVKGVMFDFSGTLLRIEPIEQWLRGALDDSGRLVRDDAEVTACADRLRLMGAQPGGPVPHVVPQHLADLWRDRDLTGVHHRACYTALAREAQLPDPALAEALYERTFHPMAWQPYPDTVHVLRELRQRGVPTAVVSNIGWDLRPVFKFHGLAQYIDFFVLSYEIGVMKPDPRIFHVACDELGLAPDSVLMVGDDRDADTGAATLGCPVHLVEPLPVSARPDSLTRVLDLLGDGYR